MSLGKTNLVTDLREDFDGLSRCCLKSEREGFAPVAVLAHYRNVAPPEYWEDEAGSVIFENADGRFGIFEDWEDTSGHG